MSPAGPAGFALLLPPKLTALCVLVLPLTRSLALVLPKYSEHFIQAKLGDDIKQAMCE